MIQEDESFLITVLEKIKSVEDTNCAGAEPLSFAFKPGSQYPLRHACSILQTGKGVIEKCGVSRYDDVILIVWKHSSVQGYSTERYPAQLRTAEVHIFHSIRLERFTPKRVVIKHDFTQQTAEVTTGEAATLKIYLQQVSPIEVAIRKCCNTVRRTAHVCFAEIHTFKMINVAILNSSKR